MAVSTVRKVPDEVHRALRARATKRGRSAEAEMLLADVDICVGDELATLGRASNITDNGIDAVLAQRGATPAPSVVLE